MEPMQFAVNSSWIMAIISWVFVLSVILYTKLERRIIKSEDNMIKLNPEPPLPIMAALDANHDGRVRDACYASPKISAKGISGLSTNASGLYELKGSVMIWSRGPDGKFDVGKPANTGVNQDNVTSWQ